MVEITFSTPRKRRANASRVTLGAPEANFVRTGLVTAQALEPPASFMGREVDVDRQDLSAADAAAVYRFVARRVANGTDAADIAQQTLLLACANRSTCRGESLSAWLFTIASNLIVDHYRAKNRFQFLEVAALMDTESALQTPPDSSAIYEGRERLRGWLDCITHRLRLEEQAAVLLADIYDHRDKDSAAVLRMSVPSFKLLLHGARARLREIVGGNGVRVRNTTAAACDDSKNAQPGNGGPPSKHRKYGTGVTCHLGAPELLALRDKLLAGLST